MRHANRRPSVHPNLPPSARYGRTGHFYSNCSSSFFYFFFPDIFGIHTENCFMLLAITFFLVAWSADRMAVPGSRTRPGFKGFNECVLSMILHYGCYLSILLFFNAEDEVSIGVHEPTGPCNATSPIQTAFGMVQRPFFLIKRKSFLNFYLKNRL